MPVGTCIKQHRTTSITQQLFHLSLRNQTQFTRTRSLDDGKRLQRSPEKKPTRYPQLCKSPQSPRPALLSLPKSPQLPILQEGQTSAQYPAPKKGWLCSFVTVETTTSHSQNQSTRSEQGWGETLSTWTLKMASGQELGQDEWASSSSGTSPPGFDASPICFSSTQSTQSTPLAARGLHERSQKPTNTSEVVVDRTRAKKVVLFLFPRVNLGRLVSVM
ncbi:hypothetical protein CMEL01_12542 [Colletotrichum melonis]|uniref:Uncharacterized protein n=1 Tax=Colletotrichum melonis TaxID=1209925 RepID=A0AAI9UY53_9PEZI|nr:hypothetical protein CMEL01_12542 [Colletotrichum melonis]